MKDKLGGTAFMLMLFGAGCMDSPDLTIPVAILLTSFALMGIVFAMEYHEGLHGGCCRSLRLQLHLSPNQRYQS